MSNKTETRQWVRLSLRLVIPSAEPPNKIGSLSNLFTDYQLQLQLESNSYHGSYLAYYATIQRCYILQIAGVDAYYSLLTSYN